jgi:hypothetical protein
MFFCGYFHNDVPLQCQTAEDAYQGNYLGTALSLFLFSRYFLQTFLVE